MKQRQAALIPRTWLASHFAFGGVLLKGSHPKRKRPFSSALPLHLVLRSSRAQGKHSLLKFNDRIEVLLLKQAELHHICIYGAANAGNHIHLLVRAPSREHLAAFLRAVSGRIAQIVEGKSKERLRKCFEKSFWDARPFSRLVSWGRDFKNVARYIGINSTETALRQTAFVSSDYRRASLESGSRASAYRKTRTTVRAMFDEMAYALERGWLKPSPNLVATGFG